MDGGLPEGQDDRFLLRLTQRGYQRPCGATTRKRRFQKSRSAQRWMEGIAIRNLSSKNIIKKPAVKKARRLTIEFASLSSISSASLAAGRGGHFRRQVAAGGPPVPCTEPLRWCTMILLSLVSDAKSTPPGGSDLLVRLR